MAGIDPAVAIESAEQLRQFAAHRRAEGAGTRASQLEELADELHAGAQTMISDELPDPDHSHRKPVCECDDPDPEHMGDGEVVSMTVCQNCSGIIDEDTEGERRSMGLYEPVKRGVEYTIVIGGCCVDDFSGGNDGS